MAERSLIPRDPGLQPERTRLAWSRTGFSLALFTLLCLRGWCRDGNPFYAGATLICGVAAATILFNRHQRNGKHILSLSLFTAGMLLFINGLRHILG
ncbi:DUF202 domain-containing protein [Atlantibacter hermannii]|uniref:DUF202 domain-containing protein n=1 Tax=Atlantibacter hermannii TaxID=565 RepID=UPI002540FF7B|nr:DUF202 domain-containing protein [Atlantibacter hermannii]MEB7923711.1 DUF202 domain-containing protein [Atlantibacter hermannii]WIF57804.1 DUF202 domain-containing protein [Atlantibacter hermannii]